MNDITQLIISYLKPERLLPFFINNISLHTKFRHQCHDSLNKYDFVYQHFPNVIHTGITLLSPDKHEKYCYIKRTWGTTKDDWAHKFPNLKSITLSCHFNNINMFHNFSPNILHITLHDCPNLTNISSLSQCSKLRTLQIRFCRNIQHLPFLSPKLKSITIYSCFNINNITTLHICTNLRSITIYTYGSSFSAPIDLSPLKSCIKLKHIKLLGNSFINTNFITKLTKLKYLSMSGSPPILPPNLTSLHISNSPIKNTSLLKSCINLKYLKFVACHSLIDFSHLQLPTLRTLNLTFCKFTQLLNIGLCPSLHTLSLRETEPLKTLKGFSNFPSLKHLDLSCCEWLSTLNGLEKCLQLETINLNTCHALRDVTTLKSCIHLHTIYMYNPLTPNYFFANCNIINSRYELK